MNTVVYTRIDAAQVLPLQAALDRYRPAGVLPDHLSGLTGTVCVFEATAHFESLDLDRAFYQGGHCGALFLQGLQVDSWLIQAEPDFGPFVYVQGAVRAQNIVLGGGYAHFAGDVKVEQTLLAGFYNHGQTLIDGSLHAPLLMSFDHGFGYDAARLNTQVFLSDRDRDGVSQAEPAQVLPRTVWRDGTLDEQAVIRAAKAGKALLKAVPVSPLQKRLDKAAASKAGKADLSRLKLKALPPELFTLPAVTALDLSDNPLEAVDARLQALTQLEVLSLARCGLAAAPAVLARMPALEQIDLSGNPISQLPDDWAGLTRLRRLDLRDAELTLVPRVLAELPQLADLDLSCQTDESALVIDGGFAALERLVFRGRLDALPPRLASLTWGAYSTPALPPVLLAQTSLKLLDVRGARRLAGLPGELARFSRLAEIGVTLHEAFDGMAVLADLPRLDTVRVRYAGELIPPAFYAVLDAPQWTTLEVDGWLDDSSVLARILERPGLKKLIARDRHGELAVVEIARERRRLGIGQ